MDDDVSSSQFAKRQEALSNLVLDQLKLDQYGVRRQRTNHVGLFNCLGLKPCRGSSLTGGWNSQAIDRLFRYKEITMILRQSEK